MRPGKELIGLPIISTSDGRQIGAARDLYVDAELHHLTGVFVGSEGIFSRKALLIPREQVVVFGVDAILVKGPDVISDSGAAAEIMAGWLRREKLQGREVDTAGGTKVGVIGDVILDEEARIVGFALSRVHVAGPVAENKAIAREAVLDTGHEDGVMTIDLAAAEQQKLSLADSE